MSSSVVHLADILQEQADLLMRLEEIVTEHRQALIARRPDRAETAELRLQTLALRFRMLEKAREMLVAEMRMTRGLPADTSLASLVDLDGNATPDLARAFAALQRAATLAVKAGAVHTRFVQRSAEAGEGLRRLFEWAAGGSYTARGDVATGPARSRWEGRV
ncbi:MAG: flagellar export chaperone FlgN [Acidobacteriota bacterium]